MSENKVSLGNQYFDDVYNNNQDPWSFETSPYESKKYKATVDSLPKGNYENVFEIGCSIGVLTKRLLTKSTKILAVDPADIALEQARARLDYNPNVLFEKMLVPKEFPSEQFDLIVLSEVGYYLNIEDLQTLANKIIGHLVIGGQLIMVHWTPLVHDYPLTGDQVHDHFFTLSGNNKPLKNILSTREEKYRLDLFEKK